MLATMPRIALRKATTMPVPAQTLRDLQEVGRDLYRMGLVTSHGGNSAAMSLVAQDLRARHGMLAVTTSWSRFGVPDGLFTAEEIRHGVHGGAIETSIMLAAWPDQVRVDRIAAFTPSSIAMERDFKWLNAHRPTPFAWAAQDLHPSGAAGDATKASAEKGRALLDYGARAFCELLQDVEKFDMKQFGNQ